jgi:hypothetical protein
MAVGSLPVQLATRVLGVSESGYYEWRGAAAVGPGSVSHAWLTEQIQAVHVMSRGIYGARRIHAELTLGLGITVGRAAVERLMRLAGIKGLPGNRRPRPRHQTPTAADLVDRQFARPRPDQLWATDITEHPTREGKVYCAVVLDTFSRRVVGWSIDSSQTAGLVTSALDMAIRNRRPGPDLVIHSDHGAPAQGTSWAFTQRARASGLLPSMGSIGDCYDKGCVSHCTSWRGLCWNSVPDGASLPGDEARVAGCGRLEQPLVLVVGLVRDEQPGAVPVLDRGGVHSEGPGDLGHVEQAAGSQPLGVAGHVVCAA